MGCPPWVIYHYATEQPKGRQAEIKIVTYVQDSKTITAAATSVWTGGLTIQQ
jgi:hypothetical protein